MPPIKGVSEIVRMPRLGHIRLGIKVEKQGKQPYPQATDHFVVPEEVEAIFGDKPTELGIMFPSEDPDQFARQWYRCYSRSQGLVCIGDGETSRRKVDLDTGAMAGRDTTRWEWREGLPCAGESCPDYETKRCRRVMNLQFLMPKVKGLGVWQIDTSSFWSMVNINSMVALLKALVGRCSYIPLTLVLGPTEVHPPGGSKKTVRTLHIKRDITLEEIARQVRAPALQAAVPEPDTERPPEGIFAAAVIAEAGEVSEEEIEAVSRVLDEEEGAPGQKVVEQDLSLIKTKNDFYHACFTHFKMQPRDALSYTGYSSEVDVGSWATAFLNVAGAMGATVIEPST